MLLSKGNTEKHAYVTVQRVNAIVETCGFAFTRDTSAHKIAAYLKDRRQAGLSIKSSNDYLQAIKQFYNWMVADRRMPDSPLAHLQGLNAKTDRRHDRRALEVAELRRLLETTRKAPKRFGMTPPATISRWKTDN